jgi:hypothetical protein
MGAGAAPAALLVLLNVVSQQAAPDQGRGRELVTLPTPRWSMATENWQSHQTVALLPDLLPKALPTRQGFGRP